MSIKKETTTNTNSKIMIFMSTYYFNFQNFLFTFKALVFLMIAGTISFSVAAKSEENSTNKNIYKSIFDSYENWEWEDTSDWIISNNTVDEIGGWQYYSREKSKEKK
jgi:hypothetical protein